MGPKRPYFQLIDGVHRGPNFKPEDFRKSLLFRAQRGDVLQSTYPKSGTMWIQYITQLILKEGDPVRNFEDYCSNTRSVEYSGGEDWRATLPLRTYFTHLPLNRDTMNVEAKYVYIARNPWDVSLSFFDMVTDLSVFRFQDGSFDDFLDGFLAGDFGHGSYFEHVASGFALKDEPNVFFATYEEFKNDTHAAVLRLARFLGERFSRNLEDKSNGLLDTLLDRSTAEGMTDAMVVCREKEITTGWGAQTRLNNVTSRRGYQGDSERYAVVRKATVGGWKEALSPDQLRRIEANIQDWGERASFMSIWNNMREEAFALSGSLS